MTSLSAPRCDWRQDFRDELRVYGWLILLAIANAFACWLITQIVGGSAFLSEIPHGVPPFIEMGGERVEVSWWLHEFSFWHGASVFFSVPFVLLVGVILLARFGVSWARESGDG